MTPQRWNDIQAVFEQAIACAPEERTGVLAIACAEDTELRAEVESLLSHHDSAGPGFLLPRAHAPAVRNPEPPPDSRIGRRIGRFEITGLISSGGMGVVYKAVQDRPRRTVALKIMRAGLVSKSALRRFTYEAELLARLQHPNIAQVYEAGMHEPPNTLGGQDAPNEFGDSTAIPYFAMEYIPDARSLTDYAEAANLSTRQKLALFVEVCDAVHHGHQKGIIHRDLKPSNMLVNADGHVKIIDFGVSKCTDADLAVTTAGTDVGELVGTLSYMSPEQCEGKTDLDTRSDVYALGVVLYELLCGRLPYDLTHGSWVGRARTICEELPVRPTQINKKLRGDLEAIVLKTLDKDRERRYVSTAALADDLRRHLAGEAVTARPPTRWVRLSRWAARHPKATTGLACLLIALGAVIAVSAGINTAMMKPVRVEYDKVLGHARLISVAGYPIHTWAPDPPIRISSARSAHIPPSFRGAGPAVVLTYSSGDPSSKLRGLFAYPTEGDRDKPIWSRLIEVNEVPPKFIEDRINPVSNGARILLLDDIFPFHEGKEIVVQHMFGGDTPTIVRVVDLDGQVLYEFAHDGMVRHDPDGAYWMADEGLLVFAGYNGEAVASKRGAPNARIGHPLICFAVRPRKGVLHREFLATGPDFGTVEPEWYLAVEPMDKLQADSFLKLSEPYRGSDPGTSVFLSVCFPFDDKTEACLEWEIDCQGQIVPNSLHTTNAYRANENKLPPAEEFYLAPLQPIQVDSTD